MAWREFLFSAVRTAYRALPPCHICGEPGAQFCRQCGKVACHKHAFTNVAALKSVCNHCMPFPWVATEASGVSLSPDWQYSEMPWEVLGISESASVEEIKEAHRTLSKHYHPDVAGGSTELQIKVNKARDEMLRVRGEA